MQAKYSRGRRAVTALLLQRLFRKWRNASSFLSVAFFFFFFPWFFIVFDLCLWFILVKLQFPGLLPWPCCNGFGQEAKRASGINKVPNAVHIF